MSIMVGYLVVNSNKLKISTWSLKICLVQRSLVETLKKARPTVFIGFPFIYELLMSSILDSEEDKTISKQINLSWAVKDSQRGQEKFRFGWA